MATTVNSINTCDGAITLASSVPGILGVSNNPTAPFTITLAPINANVGSLNGKLGAVVLASPDNTLAFAPTALGSTINISGYVPTGSGGAGSALLQAQNLTGALAWAGSGSPPISTVAYTPGALVVYSSTTFVCLVAQPVGSALPVNGANWQSIGGGGSGGSSITGGGATVACDTPGGSGSITLTTTETGSAGSITLDSTVGSSGVIAIKSAGDILLDGTPVGGGVRINTATTSSIFEDTNTTGLACQIQIASTDATNPAKVSI
jgi:hypothetical protein